MILTRGIRNLLPAFFALSLASAPAQNATPPAPVEFDIFDQSGATIPNARIELTESSTKIERHFEASTHGTLLVQVPEGTYTLRTSSPGFVVSTQPCKVRRANTAPVRIVLSVAQAVIGGPVFNQEVTDLALAWPQVSTMINPQTPVPMNLSAIKLPKHHKLFQHFNS